MQTQHNFVSVVNESPISQTIEVEKNHTPEYNDLLKDFCGERPTVINETREKCCKCKAIHLIMVCLLKKKKMREKKMPRNFIKLNSFPVDSFIVFSMVLTNTFALRNAISSCYNFKWLYSLYLISQPGTLERGITVH